ncbi:MAG TPA: divalent metal cation transporter [Puia sp.]|jgi:NRAMP (natural resistance-associated macrophage protein)-like metal ion transporter|nr:divalent metal cation transporter [Puia sp.]
MRDDFLMNGKGKFRRFIKILGPGLITGASDDDPSGIVTYSQAGAVFGLKLLWMAPFTFPLMAAMQGMCARIGIVTSQGLTNTLKKYYHPVILWAMLIFSVPAIILNIGADIAGMGAVTNLLFPKIPSFIFSLVFTIIMMVTIVLFPYQKIAGILKWLCLSMFLYLVVPFIVHVDWKHVLISTLIPHIELNKNFIEMLVAILGTTISPYLFFWQATMEAEDVEHQKKQVIVDKQILQNMTADVNTGMFASNFVMLFIILTTGVVLYNSGFRKIDTVEQAAKALAPLAGKFSYICFALGVIGTGLLAIPVLTGSLSYILAESFGWEEGLDKKFHEARAFYIVIILSLVIGLLINIMGISPMQALIYTAILYGVTSPVMIAVILHIGNNKKIMNNFTNSRLSNILGGITFIIMSVATILLLYFQFK